MAITGHEKREAPYRFEGGVPRYGRGTAVLLMLVWSVLCVVGAARSIQRPAPLTTGCAVFALLMAVVAATQALDGFLKDVSTTVDWVIISRWMRSPVAYHRADVGVVRQGQHGCAVVTPDGEFAVPRRLYNGCLASLGEVARGESGNPSITSLGSWMQSQLVLDGSLRFKTSWGAWDLRLVLLLMAGLVAYAAGTLAAGVVQAWPTTGLAANVALVVAVPTGSLVVWLGSRRSRVELVVAPKGLIVTFAGLAHLFEWQWLERVDVDFRRVRVGLGVNWLDLASSPSSLAFAATVQRGIECRRQAVAAAIADSKRRAQ